MMWSLSTEDSVWYRSCGEERTERMSELSGIGLTAGVVCEEDATGCEGDSGAK